MSGDSEHIRRGRGGSEVYEPGREPYLAGSRTAAAAAAMPSPFGPCATNPEEDPWSVIPQPDHISSEAWQTSYYNATSQAPMGAYVQRPSGPCDITTGQLTGAEFPNSGVWRQV